MKTFKEYMLESEENNLKIGKVSLNLYKKDDREFVIIKPDINQSDDHKEIAKNWINNHFLDKSKYKSGTTSFSINDWKKPGGLGEKFVEAIKKSKNTISWVDLSEKKTIMKGIKGLSDNQQFGEFPGSSPLGGLFRGGMGGGMGGGIGGGIGGELGAGLGIGGGSMPPPAPSSQSPDLSSGET